MKIIYSLFAVLISISCFSQKRVNPVIKSISVFDVPDAAIKPDPTIQYQIVIELRDNADPKAMNEGLYNIARLINLHISGGVPKENLDVVVVVHGDATFTLTDSKLYEKRYKAPNPNLDLYKELADAGINLVVCGQSLLARNVERSALIPEVKVATSALTTITTYQLKGYAYLKF